MEQPAPPDPPAPSTRHRRAHWTPALQASFLGILLQTGSVRHAARAVGMSPSSAHRLRHRLTGTEFDRNWDEALMLHGALMTRPLSLDHGVMAAPSALIR